MEYKFGRFAIHNLMLYVVLSMGIVFIVHLLGIPVISMLMFDSAAIMRGEVWRLVTFIFIPPNMSPIFIIFSLYLYWMFGSALEAQWGTFRFNLFYLCGMLGTMLGALFMGWVLTGNVVGWAFNNYINWSLFVAFAILFPNFELRLFFVLPVKIKWMALLMVVLMLWSFVTSPWWYRLTIVISLANLLLFFYKELWMSVQQHYKKWQWQRRHRR